MVFTDRCCNPFGLNKHLRKSNLRIASDELVAKMACVKGLKLCGYCRGKVMSAKQQTVSVGRPNSATVPQPSEPSTSTRIAASTANEPMSQSEIIQNVYSQSTQSSQCTFSSDPTVPSQNSDVSFNPSQKLDDRHVVVDKDWSERAQAGLEVLEKLKEKFQEPTTTRSEKIRILTLKPKNWSIRKTARFFHAPRRMVRTAVDLVESHGILTSPNPKQGKTLDESTMEAIRSFYEHDANSKQMAGKNDYVSVKQSDGTRKHEQKRLIYCNLRELHKLYLETHPGLRASFSTFAKLRPRHCILAGASGTHSVCVCVYHENVKLMIDAVDFNRLTKHSSLHLNTYEDFINVIICDAPNAACYLGECDACPGSARLASYLRNVFDEAEIDDIQFHNWTETDRAAIQIQVLSTDAFVDDLCSKVEKLKTHAYIARQQSQYLDYRKQNLNEGEFIVQCDFAENYAFVAQNSIQGFHWNNDQCTIHTVVYYYKDGSELRHGSMAILSDDLRHNTVAVYAFQRIIIDHLKAKFNPKSLVYFTDGAGQQYKNRFNFSNLLNHEQDFGLPAEWHFFGTAHGKGPCDGIGGNLKRLAARASLQAATPDEQILTPLALFNWANNNLTKTSVHFSPRETHDAAAEFLSDRFKEAKTVPGTLKYHSVTANDNCRLILRKYSSAADFITFPKDKIKLLGRRAAPNKADHAPAEKRRKRDT